jgi:uncharacterized membrane protein YjjP (DUF1212 family)
MLEVSTKQIFKSWLLFMAIGTVGGFVAGMIGGGITGFVMGVALGLKHLPKDQMMAAIRTPAIVAGYVCGVPVSFLGYWWTVKRLVSQLSTSADKQTSETV